MPEDDYPDEPRPAGPVERSGAVTLVAIVNFIVGGLTVLFGLLFMFLGPAAMAWAIGQASDATPAGATPEQAELAKKAAAAGGGILAAIAGFIGVCYIIFGLPQIIAGIGVMNRKQWGRILAIVMGFIAAIFAVLNLFALPASIVSLILNGGYALVTLIILFNSKYAAEFRSPPAGGM
jgi:hypothetical protein